MRSRDLTKGSIIKGFILFALPLLGGSLFQQLYSTVDMLFVGNFLGKNAAAAIGASSILVNCLIRLFTGISVGAGVVIAQYFGAGEHKKMRDCMWVSLVAGTVGGIVLEISAVSLAEPMLQILNTPQVIMPEALLYVRIYFLAMIPMILYNISSGALRAQGDAKTPFYILIAGGMMNVVLDAVFIGIVRNGVCGAAVATLLSQCFTAVISCICLLRKNRNLHRQTFTKGMLMRILKVGFPVGIESMLMTISNVVIQYYINGFGENAVAAFSVYYKAENILYLPIMAFGQAMLTFTGQNYGAGRMDRIRHGAWSCTLVSVCTVGLLSMVSVVYGTEILGIFCPDEGVIAEGLKIIRISFPLYFLYGILEVTGGIIRGMGKTLWSMIVLITNLCGLRIVLLPFLEAQYHSLSAVAAVYPITWGLTAISFALSCVFLLRKKSTTAVCCYVNEPEKM